MGSDTALHCCCRHACRVHYFAAGTPGAVREAVEQGEEEGVAGYLLDLRNNPGGS